MANGDPVGKGHYKLVGTLLTSTDALQDFLSFDLSTLDGGLLGVDSIITAKGWAHGRALDDTEMGYGERIATAHVDAGALDLDGTDQVLASEETDGLLVRFNTSGNTLKLQIATGTSAAQRWHGGLEIWITEQAMTG